MKRLVLLLAMLLLVGCSTQTPKPPEGPVAPKQPAVSEEAAVKAAKSADPQAGVEGWATWQVRYAENTEVVVNGKTEKLSVWIVEATHKDGSQITVYVDAMTYPVRVLRVDTAKPTYITREKAIEVALQGSTEVQVKEARFFEKFLYDNPLAGSKELPVWIVDLVSKADMSPRSRIVVDAVTGKVLMVSDPPSGQ